MLRLWCLGPDDMVGLQKAVIGRPWLFTLELGLNEAENRASETTA